MGVREGWVFVMGGGETEESTGGCLGEDLNIPGVWAASAPLKVGRYV